MGWDGGVTYGGGGLWAGDAAIGLADKASRPSRYVEEASMVT